MLYVTKGKTVLEVASVLLEALRTETQLLLDGRTIELDKLQFNYRDGVVKLGYWVWDEALARVFKNKYEQLDLTKEKWFNYTHINEEGEVEDVYHYYVGVRHNLEYKELVIASENVLNVEQLHFSKKVVVPQYPIFFNTRWLFGKFKNAIATEREQRGIKTVVLEGTKQTKYEDRKRKELGLTKYKTAYKDTRYSDILLPKPTKKHVSTNSYAYDKVFLEFLLYGFVYFNFKLLDKNQLDLTKLTKGQLETVKLQQDGYNLILKDYWWKANREGRRKKTYEKY